MKINLGSDKIISTEALHHLSETVFDELENNNNCAILSIDGKRRFDTRS